MERNSAWDLDPKKSSGFTLIELLVVIAIISILAAILFPVFTSARERARQTGCLSNARQIAAAVMMYADDYDSALPPSTNYALSSTTPGRIWPQIIQPYVKNNGIFVCPSAQNASFPSGWEARGSSSIGYTTVTAYDPSQKEGFASPAYLQMMEDSSRTPLFTDTASGPTAQKYRGYCFDPYNGQANTLDPRLGTPLVADRDLVQELNDRSPAALKPIYARHLATGNNSGYVTLILADGHAKAYSAASILAQERGAALYWRFR